MQDLKVPAGFNWSTTKTYNVEISLKSSDDQAVKNVAVKLMSDSYENKGDLLLKAGTDENGTFKTQITLPAGMKQVVLNSSYFGLPKDIIVDLTSSNIKMQLVVLLLLQSKQLKANYLLM
jgi:hypothetical protein